MKRVLSTLVILAVCALWSTAALATTYSYDYLFNGSGFIDGVGTGDLTNVGVNFTFDSDAVGVRSRATLDSVTYLVPFSNANYNGLSLSVAGQNLLDLLNFNYATAATISLVNGVLSSLSVNLVDSHEDVFTTSGTLLTLAFNSASLAGGYEYFLTDNWTGQDVSSGEGNIKGTLSAPTPIPGALILLGSGLLGLVGLRRRNA